MHVQDINGLIQQLLSLRMWISVLYPPCLLSVASTEQWGLEKVVTLLEDSICNRIANLLNLCSVLLFRAHQIKSLSHDNQERVRHMRFPNRSIPAV